MSDVNALSFWGADKAHGWLSNFWLSPIEVYRPVLKRDAVKGVKLATNPESYASVEHWFQAEKFRGTDGAYRRQVAQVKTPAAAARLGKSRAHPLRRDWEAVKERVMLVGLWRKFADPLLKQKLLATGGAELIEASPYDAYWGTGPNGNGLNRLGEMLQQLRGRLKSPDQQRRVIVAGGRGFVDYHSGVKYLNDLFKDDLPDEVISGTADGADTVGEIWALHRYIPVQPFPADWGNISAPGAVVRQGRHGAYNAIAGHQRNAQMAEYGTHLVAFWDGKSKGTRNMIGLAEERGLDVEVIHY